MGTRLKNVNVSFRKRSNSCSVAIAEEEEEEEENEDKVSKTVGKDLRKFSLDAVSPRPIEESDKIIVSESFGLKSGLEKGRRGSSECRRRRECETCGCRKDSLISTGGESVSSYPRSPKRKDSSVSNSTCQTILIQSGSRRESEENPGGIVTTGEVKKVPLRGRSDSGLSLSSLRRDSCVSMNPKIFRRRFSEQLILEGGLAPDSDLLQDLDPTQENDEDELEESLTTVNARKRITLKRHYYPEGGWGFAIITVSILVQILSHGVQIGAGPLLIEVTRRFDVKFIHAGKKISSCEMIPENRIDKKSKENCFLFIFSFLLFYVD